ncbi:PH domain-containing protein DDB_G0287875 [Drosophila eugracilis]|uniref:PH domain-containing protein DDB_G0287875 n=1 Tax=Drosophila eugracilis TaxID=29029 RepID=UPI0007E6C251|nr:PH domain-containing protein DDB_G0287875 [Drosophila eugracilis]
MIGVVTRFLWSLAMVQCIYARVSVMPFFGQDSAVIVDINRKLPSKLDSKLQNALYYNMPVYKLIKPNSPSTTTTTAAPDWGYPEDLLDIAHNKLGLKNLPNIEDLGEMIGTDSDKETIDYIRTLAGNDGGLALMKQYISILQAEEDVPEDKGTADDNDNDDDDNDDNNTMNNSSYDELPQEKSTTEAPKPELSLLERIGGFMKHYNLWTGEVTTTTTPAPFIAPSSDAFQPFFVAPPSPANMKPLRPFLVRQPLPYHYPIPLRPVALPTIKPIQVTTSTTTPAPKPHLNTPKLQEDSEFKYSSYPPYIQQFAKLANISPHVVDHFLERQPKLSELAKRLSTLALSQEQIQDMDDQVLKAIQNALAKNDDLKRLIEASQALK